MSIAHALSLVTKIHGDLHLQTAICYSAMANLHY